jgi:hypothetical protein
MMPLGNGPLLAQAAAQKKQHKQKSRPCSVLQHRAKGDKKNLLSAPRLRRKAKYSAAGTKKRTAKQRTAKSKKTVLGKL